MNNLKKVRYLVPTLFAAGALTSTDDQAIENDLSFDAGFLIKLKVTFRI